MQSVIDVSNLFKPLDDELISLLEKLDEADWISPTIAGKWCVKDVVAHLLDGNIRALSMQRDQYFGESTPTLNEYQDLVQWLNKLNGDWVNAMKRVSPEVLILLHKATGTLTSAYFSSLSPFEEAIFAVEWAGESKSYNWMHQAREYTEKWHHQQQIRDAVGIEGIMTSQFYPPFIQTYMRGLPNAFKGIKASIGTTIKVTVSSTLGGDWFLIRVTDGWSLAEASTSTPAAEVVITPQVAWKLFSKNVRPKDVREQVELSGDLKLAAQVLEMVSVIA